MEAYGIQAPDLAAARNYQRTRVNDVPAFSWDSDGRLELTPASRRIIETASSASGKPFRVEPFNSVQARDGRPMWGSGEGSVLAPGNGVAYVDPIEGNTFVIAHEAGHALAPSDLAMTKHVAAEAGRWASTDPLSLDRDSGRRLRYVHETLAKPHLIEEANANGFAEGLLEGLGMPGRDVQDSWKEPLDYPRSAHDKGLGLYMQVEIGPPSPGEKAEARRLLGGSEAAMMRTYQDARHRAHQWARDYSQRRAMQ